MTETPAGQAPEPPRNLKAEARAAKAYAKASRPWYKKKRWIALIIIGIFAIGGVATGGEDTPVASSSDTTSDSSGEDTASDSSGEDTEPAAEEEPAEPELTTSQENALRSAENYLEFAPFSKKGLIQQLSSQAGDGYPRKDAVFAVNQLDVDWREQAVIAGQNYLDLMGMSRDGLIQQLSSNAGDGYTRAEATYAADKLGL